MRRSEFRAADPACNGLYVMADSLKQCPNCPRMVPAHVETCFCGYRFPPPLKWLVEEELRQEPNLDSALITVAAQNGDVTLVGHVPSDDD